MSRSPGARTKTATVAALVAAAVVVVPAAPASAALTATLSDLTLPAVPYSFQPQTVSGRVTLTAADSYDWLLDPSLQSDGWNVTLQFSPLQYIGENAGTDLPAANLAIAAVETPVASTSGSQDVDPVGGPKVPDVSPLGSLDTPRAVLEAEPGFGAGTYVQGMTLALTVPGGARAGTYTGIITTTISPGPIP